MATITKDVADTPETTEQKSHVDSMLDATRAKYEAELEKLRPQHEAFLKLEALVNNFEAITSGQINLAGRKRGTSAIAGDRASRGQRPAEFLSFVAAAGAEGTTVAEIADKMPDTNQNYLYRIAKELTEAGSLRKDAKRYYVV